MKPLCLISLLAMLLVTLSGCAKDKKGMLDGGYYFFDVSSEVAPDLTLWIDKENIHAIEHNSTSSALNGFIEEDSKNVLLRGSSKEDIQIRIRFGSVEEKEDIVVIERTIEAGSIDASWSLDKIRALAVNLHLKCTTNLRIKMYHLWDVEHHQSGTSAINPPPA